MLTRNLWSKLKIRIIRSAATYLQVSAIKIYERCEPVWGLNPQSLACFFIMFTYVFVLG